MPQPNAPVALTAARTLTFNDTGTLFLFNAAAGFTVTLPAATGSGAEFEFLVNVTVTSSNDVIAVVGNDIMQGRAYIAQDAADTVVVFETAADSDTITMNGSTKGGIKGDRIRVKDIAADTWQVELNLAGTGTEATPFSAAVS